MEVWSELVRNGVHMYKTALQLKTNVTEKVDRHRGMVDNGERQWMMKIQRVCVNEMRTK